jgi:hypothetical protein
VLTRSAVLAIFAALLTWFALYVLGLVHTWVNTDLMTGRVAEVKEGEEAPTGRTLGESNPTLQGVAAVVNILHAVLPRTSDLGQLSSELVSRDLLSENEKRDYGLTRSPPVNLAASLGVSLAFIAVMLGLACWRFATRDY